MRKTEPFSMRLDPDLKAKLQAKADAENRSLTNYIETVLKADVADLKLAGKGNRK